MPSIGHVPTHGAEYLRLLDAKDDVGIVDLLTEDAQVVDEITRRWHRGRHEIGAALRMIFSRVSDIKSTAEDIYVTRWADVEVETFILRQVYDLDGVTTRVVSPTCLIWRRTPAGWRLALMQSVPTNGG